MVCGFGAGAEDVTATIDTAKVAMIPPRDLTIIVHKEAHLRAQCSQTDWRIPVNLSSVLYETLPRC